MHEGVTTHPRASKVPTSHATKDKGKAILSDRDVTSNLFSCLQDLEDLPDAPIKLEGDRMGTLEAGNKIAAKGIKNNKNNSKKNATFSHHEDSTRLHVVGSDCRSTDDTIFFFGKFFRLGANLNLEKGRSKDPSALGKFTLEEGGDQTSMVCPMVQRLWCHGIAKVLATSVLCATLRR